MKVLAIVLFFFGFLLGYSSLVYSSEQDLDKHIREVCPAAAAWKDRYDLDVTSDMAPRQVISAPKLPSLHDNLLRMAQKDQNVRDAWRKVGYSVTSKEFEDVRRSDSDNFSSFISAIGSNGFPTVEQVGVDGVKSAWLILQHADAHPKMQVHFLATLNPEKLPTGIGKKEFALLRDRVQVNLERPQIYGTQFRKVDGQWAPYPIFRLEGLDRRRAELGLMPFSLYRCVVLAMANYEGS